MKQTILWTVLPHGIDRSGAAPVGRFSVHVGLRLEGDGDAPKLRDFEIGDWPTKRFEFGLRVVGPGGATLDVPVRPVRETGVPATPDAELWHLLFPPDLAVEPRVPTSLHDQNIRSFSAEILRDIVRELYSDVAALTPTEPPTVESLAYAAEGDRLWKHLVMLRFGRGNGNAITDLRADRRRALDEALDQGAWPGTEPTVVGPPGGGNALEYLPLDGPVDGDLARQYHLVQHEAFLEPRSGVKVSKGGEDDVLLKKLRKPQFDFHRALSIAGNHPTILRRIGLVLDFEFDASAIGWLGDAATPCTAQLTIAETPFTQPTVMRRHVTASSMSRTAFLSRTDGVAAPFGYLEERDGFLPFEDRQRFHTIEVDADGAAIKSVTFAEQLLVQVAKTSDDPFRPAAVPALRSFGLSIAERNRAVLMLARFKLKRDLELAALAPDAEVTVHVEDITRGLRLDVWDGRAGRWFSLLQRRGRYAIGAVGQRVVEAADEGWISPAPTVADGDHNPDLYLQETLALWSGWSLAAPRPGTPVSPDGVVDPAAARSGNPADTNIALSATFTAAPGSLPRLRYGTEYRFRARTVDLAGNDVGFGDPTVLGDHASAPVRYRRFEPIATPVVLPRTPRTVGETVERLVIRSDFDSPSNEPSERHLAPPRTSQLMAEQHGMFDTPAGMSNAAYADTAARDRFTFETSAQGAADPVDPDQRYFDHDVLDIGYLADPLAVGVVFTGLPGLPVGQQFPVSFVTPGAAWPARRPLRLVLIEGAGPPALVEIGGALVLTVRQPKAAVTEVAFASMLPSESTTLDVLGIWGWLEDEHQASDTLAQTILSNRHWMVTPPRTLTLVHAVRRPLVAPTFDALRLEHFMSSIPGHTGTTAFFSADVRFSNLSTQRLSVMARWTDPVDAGVPQAQHRVPPLTPNVDSAGSAVLPSGEPTTAAHSVRAFDLALPADGADRASGIELEHQLGDLKHHEIDYSVVATSRFQDYFVERLSTTIATGPIAVDRRGFVPGSVTVTRSVGDTLVTLTAGLDYTTDDLAGTVSGADTEALPNGTIVEISFVPAPITREGPSVRVSVPASAPPAPPGVLYALPTFGWSASNVGKVRKQSTRTGNGLRVYLDRPWWSSGAGELLGVSIWAPATASGVAPLTIDPPGLARSVTQYGDDPISVSTSRVTRAPRLADFPRATVTKAGLHPAEMPDQPIAVAGHAVAFDTERNLWYCDIEVNVGLAYFPFVRLALVRFQPTANPGCHISGTVLADFMQLTPDRHATLTFDPTKPLEVGISVSGVSYRQTKGLGSAVANGPTEMRVTVERLTEPAAGDVGWTPIDGLTSLPLTSAPGFLGTTTTWSSKLTLTSSRLTVAQRLVIEEFEVRGTGPQDPSRTDADGLLPDGRRLVYTDIIRL